MLRSGFAPIELDEYVTNPGVDRAQVRRQLMATARMTGQAVPDQDHDINVVDDHTRWFA